MRLDFKGVPILYTPFISFPVGNERKSGFLFPTLGTSSRSGTSLSVPWYWNIAPNYDATFMPTCYSKRGAQARHRVPLPDRRSARGTLDAEYLPDDQEFGDSRSCCTSSISPTSPSTLRLDIDAANVSDSEWFEDFGLGPGRHQHQLSRIARPTSPISTTSLARGRCAPRISRRSTTIGIAPRAAAATRCCRSWQCTPRFPDQPYGLTLGLDMEVANFEHNYDDLVATGWRIDVAPEVRMPLRGAGIYLEPAASWRYTSYQLDDTVCRRRRRLAARAPRRS